MTSSMVRDDAPGQQAGQGGPAVAPAGPTAAARPVAQPGLIRAAAGSDHDATPHPTIAPRVAHRARVYDYWLGGRDNFAADRQAGDAAAAAFPGLVHSVRASRAFLSRSVRLLAAEAGVTQFLDIGAGLPTAGSTHEVAQAADPDAMVVYLDIDPVVFAHGRALLASGPHGNTSYLRADLRDPATIVTEAARMLDLTQPVAVVAVSVLQFIPAEADPYEQVAAIMDAMAPGSYLVIGHPGRELGATAEESLAGGQSPVDTVVTVRSRAEVNRFFAGLRLLPPGLVRLPAWRPDSAGAAAVPCPLWGGVGVK